ncbi:hypothetical protein [Pseudomonas syringae]|uniref:Uncharacterized protein n=1 Tax=Pseudomonas syringae TaxID=317 RepID=A0A085V6P1_PSESX|nr:hypothetical protein [Pseudomonas syringae]KFE51104.1 hypothetical protein IV02_13920 [Pseudomonas syringae]
MKRTIITTLISLALSAALVSGMPDLHDFAFYVAVFVNVLGWFAVLSDSIKGDVASNLRKHAWMSAITSAIQLSAMIFSGHPVLAASYFLVSVAMVALAFGEKKEAPCKP